MTTVTKIKSKTLMKSTCGCGKTISYWMHKRLTNEKSGYQGYATFPKKLDHGYWYKISKFSTWRLDNHYYKCEEAQNES